MSTTNTETIRTRLGNLRAGARFETSGPFGEHISGRVECQPRAGEDLVDVELDTGDDALACWPADTIVEIPAEPTDEMTWAEADAEVRTNGRQLGPVDALAGLVADALRQRGSIDPTTYAAVHGNPDYITDEALLGDLFLNGHERAAIAAAREALLEKAEELIERAGR